MKYEPAPETRLLFGALVHHVESQRERERDVAAKKAENGGWKSSESLIVRDKTIKPPSCRKQRSFKSFGEPDSIPEQI